MFNLLQTGPLKFLDDYKLEIKEDTDYFEDLKSTGVKIVILPLHLLPNEKLDYFYKYVYRADELNHHI